MKFDNKVHTVIPKLNPDTVGMSAGEIIHYYANKEFEDACGAMAEDLSKTLAERTKWDETGAE